MAKKNIPYDQKYYDPEIECMPRPELEQLQLERLQTMVQYAYDNTVYYKRSFDAAGVRAIYGALPGEQGISLAVRNRLLKAAGHHVVHL